MMALPFAPKIFPVDSLAGYITEIEKYAPAGCLFRGEPDYFEYNFMRAKALRSASNSFEESKQDPLDTSFEMLKDFYRQVSHRISDSEKKNFTAFAQHYGIPTNLLDVTTSPLVALYFACQSRETGKKASHWRRIYLQQKPYIHKAFDYGFVYTFDQYIEATDLINTIPTNSNFIEHVFLSNSSMLRKFADLMQSVKQKNPILFDNLLNKAKQDYVAYSQESCIDSKDDLLELLFKDSQFAYYAVKDRIQASKLEVEDHNDYDVLLYCALAAYIFQQSQKFFWSMWNIDFLPNFLYRPECSFDRIKNQHGQFFYQTSLSSVDDVYDCPHHSVQRIAIGPVAFEIHNKKKILKSLDQMGINTVAIMNDFDSIAKYVTYKHDKEK